MSRYEYANDRKLFKYWVEAPGPCAQRYWSWNHVYHELSLELGKGPERYGYCITEHQLLNANIGWRRLVAKALRKMRHALRHNPS